MELINCTIDDLDELYNDSSWTWEGMDDSQENLEAIVDWFDSNNCPLKENVFYITKGDVMNDYCECTGNNCYPDDLTIMSIKLDNITNVSDLFFKKFEIGARWFDDIVDNNRRREEEKDDYNICHDNF